MFERTGRRSRSIPGRTAIRRHAENTWVIITGDHGEHFGEHRQFGHGSSLYNELTHVPLIMIPPLGSVRGRDLAGPPRAQNEVPVSLRDLPATVAELIGPRPRTHFRARASLTGTPPGTAGRSGAVPTRRARSAWRGFRTDDVSRVDSLIDDNHILIESRNRPLEMYHLVNDPLQQHNLAGLSSEQARARPAQTDA